VGLLRGSFHPPQAVGAVRTLQRHRDTLVAAASTHVQHMQKALVQRNIQWHHVISDLAGVTGLRIVDAILAGERDPQRLASLRDRRIKASVETVAKALVGDWRDELLFTLRQALAAYRHTQQQIAECDDELARRLTQFDSRVDPQAQPLPAGQKTHSQKRRPAPTTTVDLRTELYRICGVDLTAVPGIHTLTAHTLFAELGSELTAFPTVKNFASWLGLSPDNRVSGGKVLSVRTRAVNSRVALALRLAAQSLHHNDSALGHYYRRMRTRLGAPKAVTATAHKLARIIYHLLTTRQPYDESVFAQHEQRHRQRQLQHLHRQALSLGFQLVPHSHAPQ
ncbi:MAG: IS110 family transposase, partial [Burkholderiales bacterium]